jgi:hypothetical protein
MDRSIDRSIEGKTCDVTHRFISCIKASSSSGLSVATAALAARICGLSGIE